MKKLKLFIGSPVRYVCECGVWRDGYEEKDAIPLSTHWTDDQLVELADITLEEWDEIFSGYLEYIIRFGKLHRPASFESILSFVLHPLEFELFADFSIYFTALLDLAVDMTEKGLDKESYLKEIGK
jgi:hypothetical protein